MKIDKHPCYCALLLFPATASASSTIEKLDLTGHWVGYVSLTVFFSPTWLSCSKSPPVCESPKPVMLAAGIIWALIAWIDRAHGYKHTVGQAARHNLLEYTELMLFLLVAMTYINSMEERGVFDALRSWLIGRLRKLRSSRSAP